MMNHYLTKVPTIFLIFIMGLNPVVAINNINPKTT